MTTVLRSLCISIIGAAAFAAPCAALAAHISVNAPSGPFGVGQEFRISVYADSAGDNVNAFSGTFSLPPSFSVTAIEDGSSIVTLWAKRLDAASDSLSFAGVVPTGWKGSRGLLFSVVVKAVGTGAGEATLQDAQVLLADGKGTPAPLTVTPAELAVQAGVPVTAFNGSNDQNPPETFTISAERDSSIYGGDTFIVFSAVDKESGIDHYEVLESRAPLSDETAGVWPRAESPYRLNDQSRSSYVYVRAFDRSGNVRVEVMPPLLSENPPFAAYALGLILAIILFIGYLMLRKRFAR